MKADLKTRNAWKKNRQRGDVKKLSDITGKSTATISVILNTGEYTSLDDLEQINDFYKSKIKRLKKIRFR